ncbi:reverse transcriptase homolog (plasmid) [Calothrix parasitica NIES-267]|uniref:Reverse transcriptase homolog n=1 Tax=Calothrix parasitica NIES-267 TaxID=1973488 RepID=A0A1Z4M2R7_9CYAN|nr:reverse transcriptase homolog [Calothrix parasitica NIES-267]BAY87745.1 reverse transcriptase homolog [Calothrix parasitica NIES-267]BAY87749.1 reverse transcriptase homolog [Calothrix parasitica NIES-267]
MVRHSADTNELWKRLPWKKFERNLFRLQNRIYRATKDGDFRKIRSLQKLVMKSTSAIMLALRQVTQLNKGRKTAGIDGKKALNFKQRLSLYWKLKSEALNWKHQGLRSIPIPKKDGSLRMLKIPTINDRAWQCLVKLALDPAHEATFHARSYGFRAGRSAHDAQRYIYEHLKRSKTRSNTKKRVIELDIKKCFDRISHRTIMKELIACKGINDGIFRCLKSGINPDFPEQGTPQGGVSSPLLANVALNGIEEIHPSVRYADDMVIFLKPDDNADKILNSIETFLNARGMEINRSKTRITKVTKGFDFLGWECKVCQDGSFRSFPSKDNTSAVRKKLKAIINEPRLSISDKAKLLAPIYRGWRNYHKYCELSGSKYSMWALRHRATLKFNTKSRNIGEAVELSKKAFPAVGYALNQHTAVTGDKSPYDGDFIYWSKRKYKLYNGTTANLLKKQDFKCGYCGHHFIDDETIHLHHKDGNHDNWKNSNLVAIHRSCHQIHHMGKSTD